MTMHEQAKHLILGYPRGGLGYVTQLLKLTNQDVGSSFDEDTTHSNLNNRLATAHTFEVSSALVFFLNNTSIKGIKTTFVLRDPMRVFNSLYFHGTLHGERRTPAWLLACRHIPDFQHKYYGKPIKAITAFLAAYYSVVMLNRKEINVIKVEEGTSVLFKHLVGDAERRFDIYCPPDFNASGCKQMLTPSQLPKEEKAIMIDILKKLGYLESWWNPRGGHAHYMHPEWHT